MFFFFCIYGKRACVDSLNTDNTRQGIAIVINIIISFVPFTLRHIEGIANAHYLVVGEENYASAKHN